MYLYLTKEIVLIFITNIANLIKHNMNVKLPMEMYPTVPSSFLIYSPIFILCLKYVSIQVHVY